MPKIALIPGSARVPGNGKGLGAWVTSVLTSRLTEVDSSAEDAFHISTVDVNSPPHPLGPIVDGTQIPAAIRDPNSYSSPAVIEWSKFVSSCDAFIIVTPQYNWGIPGDLKNAIDHLYREWQGKPVLLVTYGGHGGSRCAAQLKEILGGGLKMHVLEHCVEVTLPSEYIRGDQRVSLDEPTPDFLKAYEPAIQEAAEEMKQFFAAKPSQS